MSSFARAVVTKYQDREPKQQKLIAWQFQRLEVLDQGGSRVGSSEGCEGRAQRSQSHALCQLLGVCWEFWYSSICRCLTPISAFSFRWRHFSCGLFMLKYPLLIRSSVIFDRGPTLVQCDLTLPGTGNNCAGDGPVTW